MMNEDWKENLFKSQIFVHTLKLMKINAGYSSAISEKTSMKMNIYRDLYHDLKL